MHAMRLFGSLLALVVTFAVASPAIAGPPAPVIKIVGDDFDANGRGDLIQVGNGGGADGFARLVLRDGLTRMSETYLGLGGGAWVVSATGDTNNDNRTDVAYVGTGAGAGANRIQTIAAGGSGVQATGYYENGGGAWALFGLYDCTNDGRADDVSVGQPATPADGFIRVNKIAADGVSIESAGYFDTGGGAWSLVVVVDTNGDGTADLVFQGNPATPAFGHSRIIQINPAGLDQATTEVYLSMAEGAWDVTAARVNADDTVTFGDRGNAGTAGENLVRYRRLNAAGNAVAFESTADSTDATLVAMADATGDGNADGILTKAGGNPTQILDAMAAVTDTGMIDNGGGAFELRRLSQVDLGDTVDFDSTGLPATPGFGIDRTDLANDPAMNDYTTGFGENGGGVWETF